MRVLIIPDIHLKPYMFQHAEKLMERGIADQAVCLMDIPDDWDKQYNIELYEQTFDAAIHFAQAYPDTLWVYGNHDLSYIWGRTESGYSSMAAHTVREKLDQLKHTLPKGNEIKYVQRIDDVVFCHGGILEHFVRSHISPSLYDEVDIVLDAINTFWENDMWKDDSPIWHRPQYSKGPMYQEDRLLQVVGHTPVEKIERVGNVISCDVFSTYRSGEPIGSEKFMVIDTKTWEYEEYL